MPLQIELTGKKAIVCASSRGLGRACAEMLVRGGASVIINGRDEAVLQQTAADIRQYIAAGSGAEVVAVAGDITDSETQERLLAACPEPDILVNNNGGPPIGDFRDLSREDLIKGVGANMIAPIELVQRVLDGMVERKYGRIVNITSITVKMPIAGLDLSSGARAGLTSFLAGIAREVAAHNVTINQLMPGFFETDRSRAGLIRRAEATNRPISEVEAERLAAIPAGRVGTPDEFGQFCAYLCSPQAGFITGQNLLMDGGMFRSAF